MPKNIQLNEQQQLAVDFAFEAGRSSERVVGAIKGAAGTGKTVNAFQDCSCLCQKMERHLDSLRRANA